MKLTSRHSQKSSLSRNPKRPNNFLLGFILIIASVITNSAVLSESAYAHEAPFGQGGNHGPKTYENVTRSRFSCMKRYRNSEGYIDTKGGDVGIAKAYNHQDILGGSVKYSYTPENKRIKIEIESHKWAAGVSSQDVWDYVNEMLSNC